MLYEFNIKLINRLFINFEHSVSAFLTTIIIAKQHCNFRSQCKISTIFIIIAY